MRVKLSFIIFLLSLSTFFAQSFAKADDVEMKIKNGQILLTSSGCDSLMAAQQGLNQFYYKKTNKEQKLTKCECSKEKKNDKNICVVDVTSQLSAEVATKLKSTPPKDGPNCFNTSLQAVGILPFTHYSDGAFFWLNGPLCKEINSADRKPGDIVSIEDDSDPIHTFIYINDKILYHKQNYTSESTPRLDSVPHFFDTLAENKACYWKSSPQCEEKLKARIYRCDSWDEYLRKFQTSTIQKEILKQINVFSCEVSQFTFTDQIIEKQPLDSLSDQIKILQMMSKENATREYDKLLKMSSSDAINIDDPRIHNYIFWRAIIHRSDSIMEQIRLLRP